MRSAPVPSSADADEASSSLPPSLARWFARKGWRLHPHQRAMLAAAEAPALLLVAPTGGGKTLAGFLPSLGELARRPPAAADQARTGGTGSRGVHTLYVSPLKALTADISRNLRAPVEAAGLPVTMEERTGDTPAGRKRRQRADPPDILLTTPESLALMLSYEEAPRIFGSLRRVIVDEIHALAESRRGDQLMLCLSRLQGLAPGLRRVGLSATVEAPDALGRFLAPAPQAAELIVTPQGAIPDIGLLETAPAPPWSGGGGRHAVPAVLDEIRRHRTTLIFHNTRAQAELFFHELWLANDDNLPIAIHHGSLDRAQRQKVEEAMARGALRAVVCTGTLDLGIDWGDVDLVIQIGAPKNIKRLVQRIGRANHSCNTPSKARLVPTNRYEVLECVAALEAVRAHDLDGTPRGPGPLDVLCQHILATACAGPFEARALFSQVRTAGPYSQLTRADFDACLDFCATGGYALRAYDRWRRLLRRPDGRWQLRDPRSARQIRMNLGTIQDSDTLDVRLRRGGRAGTGKRLGQIEEHFATTLTRGDTFLIGGQVVRFESLREMVVEVSPQPRRRPRIATYMGTKFATSTELSHRILRLIHGRDWSALPQNVRHWLALQEEFSRLPEPGRLLVESFPHGGLAHTAIYGFAGRNAQQMLGLIVTRAMESSGLGPLGFVATDHATLIWGLEAVPDPAELIRAEIVESGLEGWLADSAVMKRAFRKVATIAGLIDRRLPGGRKTGRQASFSSDILHDTLRRHDPGHLLLRITRDEAMRGLVDFGRIREMLERVQGRIDHVHLPRISPLAAPLVLEVGKVPIAGAAREQLLAEAASHETARAVLAGVRLTADPA